MGDVMTDRRDSPRFALTLVAVVTETATANVLNARSSDVSRSGCYVDTLQPLPPGAYVKILLRSGDEIFEAPARVVYMCPGLGMGINWGLGLPDKSMAILDRWMAKAAKNANG
ncbi:MAG TPA: PilZ domain-containing protein [Candidatus Acidoferrum sp.]|nr:PilZ domain-containing protein [Candidatus Acidoferrum sp.]